jgi:hypothetical protein
MSAVVEVNEIEALADYRLLWNALLWQTPEASFFRSLDWLSIHWKHFVAAGAASSRLRTLIVYAGSRPIGILPLVVRTVRHRFGTARALSYPLDGWGSYYGPLGKNPAATLLAALRHIRSTPRDWDFIDLGGTHTDGPDRWRTFRALRAVGYASGRDTSGRTAILDPGATAPRAADRELIRVAPASRADLNWNNTPEFLRTGRIEFVRYRPGGYAVGDCDPRWDLFDACRSVTCKTARRKQAPHATEVFLRDAHQAAVRTGMLDLSLLLVHGTPAAFAYGYQLGGHVTLLETGLDRRARLADPNHMLLARLLVDSRERGDQRIDLGDADLAGEEQLPIRWERIDRYVHCPWTGVRSHAARFDRWLTSRRRPSEAQTAPSGSRHLATGPLHHEIDSPATTLRLHVEGDASAQHEAELTAQR